MLPIMFLYKQYWR